MSEAAAKEDDTMTEWIVHRLYGSPLLHTDFQALHLAVHGQVNHTFLFRIVHVAVQYDVAVQVLVASHSAIGIEPASVLADVEVVAACSESHRIGGETQLAILRLHGDNSGVRAEDTCDAGTLAHLEVLTRREAMEATGVHTMVRDGVVAEEPPDEREVGSLGECVLYVFRCLSRCYHGPHHQH